MMVPLPIYAVVYIVYLAFSQGSSRSVVSILILSLGGGAGVATQVSANDCLHARVPTWFRDIKLRSPYSDFNLP